MNPPIAAGRASTLSTWPRAMPTATKGARPTRSSPVISSHWAASRRTPDKVPARYNKAKVSSAMR